MVYWTTIVEPNGTGHRTRRTAEKVSIGESLKKAKFCPNWNAKLANKLFLRLTKNILITLFANQKISL